MRRTLYAAAIVLMISAVVLTACRPAALESGPAVEVVRNDEASRVDVLVDGELFTSYVFSDTIAVLKKPVLFPIRTAGGNAVTRGYPIEPVPGERVDHPHHIGLWFNYGDVNGLDFWNNSNAVSPERASEMGVIRHRSIESTESGDGRGSLVVSSDWIDHEQKLLLNETTRFVFHAAPGVRVIDRIATLTAGDEAVSFDDNKEGMLGLRLTRALEVPADDSIRVVGRDGEVVESSGREGAGGAYLNSEGITGYPDVWGKRARWMTLSGMLDGDSVTVAILDHPMNVGHPTYWHARDYGLFAANPLGQEAFTEGEERLGFALRPNESTTFRYRIVVAEGRPAEEQIESWYDDFAASS